MKTTISILSMILAAALSSACQNPLPCTDCETPEEEAEADAAEDPVGDLPCGGADLSTDDNNCGVCGNVCEVWPNAVGTEWEAGGCLNGECAPTWAFCVEILESLPTTCAELCGFSELSCIPNGCAGHTAILFTVIETQACWQPSDPFLEFDGACEATIPATPQLPDLGVAVQCCCG